MSAILDHNQTPQRNVICCLLALEIADYDAKPVFDQIRSTQDFQNLLVDATAHICPRDLVSIECEDGALLGFLAHPQECFTIALAIREGASTQDRSHGLALRIGINLGTVQIAEDEFGHPHVSGEGRQDADRVMRQGPPRQISVSRPFFELLSRAAPELSGLLEYQGVFSDTVGPPLYLYRLSPPQRTEPERLSDGLSTQVTSVGLSVPPARAVLAIDTRTPLNGRRRLPWLREALLAGLVGAVLLTPLNRSRIEDPVTTAGAPRAAAPPQEAAVAAADPSFALNTADAMTRPAVRLPAALAEPASALPPVAKSRREARIGAAPPGRRGQQSRLVTSQQVGSPGKRVTQNSKVDSDHVAEPGSIQRRNASLLLAVKPWGEVFVDGKSVGITPPLNRFKVSPGRHQIAVTNSSLPSYQLQIVLDPEEQVTVAHDFTCISDREKPCREDLGRGLVFASRIPPAGR
jgi:hypothetical protein